MPPPLSEPDALDAKGNHYYRRRLLTREFLQDDLVKVTLELPEGTSLQSLGFDPGHGDFIRVKPYAEEHKKLVENPVGGRAYSPVSPPNTIGQFTLIVKRYGPGGVSVLLSEIPIGSELLVANHVEHVFWTERQRGYFANERNIDLSSSSPQPECVSSIIKAATAWCNVCLIAFGIGITEVAPVAMSELRDPRVKSVTILWALKRRKDAEWVHYEGDGDPDDLVRQLFHEHKRDTHKDRLRVKYTVSQEEHPDCFHGRISQDVLQRAYQLNEIPKESLRFLAVGTTGMIAFAYETLGQLGLDVVQKDNWDGSNLLYRKMVEGSKVSSRTASPMLQNAQGIASMVGNYPESSPKKHVDDVEPSSKRARI
jgi:ferredoxin-NADP reductase